MKDKWTEEQKKILMDNLEILSYKEIGVLVGKSKTAVSMYCHSHKIERSEKAQKRINKRTNTTMFVKGQKPWNTGTKGLTKPNSTSFKAGDTKSIVLPEFSISYKENKNGQTYKVIKIGSKWIRLQRYNWEQLFGPIPEGYVIVFKDGDSLNCDPENLECITKKEQLRRMLAYTIKKAEARKALQAEMKGKPKSKQLYFKKRVLETTSNEIPVKINDKMTIYVKPGQDIEAIKKKYSQLT
jgi:hypothetical protein